MNNSLIDLCGFDVTLSPLSSFCTFFFVDLFFRLDERGYVTFVAAPFFGCVLGPELARIEPFLLALMDALELLLMEAIEPSRFFSQMLAIIHSY